MPQDALTPPTIAPEQTTPRASDVALVRQARRPCRGPGPTRPLELTRPRRRSIGWRRPLALLAAQTLLLTSLGVTPMAAAPRDAEPAAPLMLSAEGDPSPTPSASPTPSPTPKPTPWPTPKGVKGLDVSHWNGFPDFDKLRRQGMRFVFSKASQGTSFVDDTYARHTREARVAGLLAGAYHFFDYNKGGKAQARHFLATLRSTTGLARLLPPVVDVETLSSLGKPDRSKARSRLHGLLDELYAQTGRYPIIYTSRHMWEKVTGNATTFGTYPLWVACWKCDDVHLPAGWSGWDYWQVGQFKFKDGTKLDGNSWKATINALQREKQRPMRLDDGAEWSSDGSVQADLRGFDGAHVRYAADGAEWGPWQPYQRRFGLKLGGKQGSQQVRLQLRSYRGVKSPVVRDSIRLDSKAPTVWGPRVALRRGVRVQRSGERIPTVVSLSASDATSGLASTALKAFCRNKERAAAYSRKAKASHNVHIDRSGCELIGLATDKLGNVTTHRLTPSLQLIDLRRSSADVTFGKGWTILAAREALGDSLARAARKDAAVKIRIDGAQFAVVARRGPAGGKLKVLVDGKRVDTIDLYASEGDPRRMVYVRDVPKGVHAVKLQATGTGRVASSGSTVWLDAVLVLDRRK